MDLNSRLKRSGSHFHYKLKVVDGFSISITICFPHTDNQKGFFQGYQIIKLNHCLTDLNQKRRRSFKKSKRNLNKCFYVDKILYCFFFDIYIYNLALSMEIFSKINELA